ncbi:hypothetical protein MTR67_023565 [Solanum verrucosum]|uniref:Reverse transcriptase domain-containing protein n=1 Tax=Solanum verrucosum TaxID=315347 RepID=A0AAF0R000_SOLVR|nr:hypothetical protein MTR67_023565 [Solanum verrucosum]
MHQLSIIAILEPFSDTTHIQDFKNQLAMEHARSNCNGKIWIFWDRDIDCVVLEEDEQQITCDIGHNELQTPFKITFVYAKCKDHLRRPLWDRMLFQAADSNKPWCSVGDYNVITTIEEKLGGVPYNMRKSLEFIATIEACGLLDLGFNGQKYTWSNNRGITQRVWKRLDRALVTDTWLKKMPQTTITHLPSPKFLDIVRTCWERTVEGNNMWKFHQKLKRLSNTLSHWSRKEFGDIFNKVKEYEEKVRTAEESLIHEHSDTNRAKLHELNAKYIRFLKVEDSILKQKTQLQWFKEGDSNTKYFHTLIRGRRRKLFIHKLRRSDGDLIQGDDNIAEAAWEELTNLREMRGPQINHLSFADDIIIFTSGRKDSLKLIMQTLTTYERISGQLINKAKSHFLLHPNACRTTYDRVKRYTGLHQKETPITYLGSPLFIGRPRLIYFSELISKIVNRITGWQSKMLSYGGKATLIKHVLQSMPIHILSAISPPPPLLLFLNRFKVLWLIFFGDEGMTRKCIIDRHGKISAFHMRKEELE